MDRKAIQQFVKIKADAQGNPPSRIHLMSTGHWHAPWHGSFEMTPEDLQEMVQNFDDGVGVVEGSKKLPINYGHDISGKAAGWIIKLTVENDNELWGDVEWTPEGERMLREGSFRYISPEWNPRSFPYQDPEDEELWLNNVLTGAGLTNIPLFKKLKPIMASLVQPKVKQASVVTTSDNKPNGEQSMDLEALRAKKLEDLSDDEKKFVEEHKSELTEDERKTFGFDDGDAAGDGSDSGDQGDDQDGGDDTSGEGGDQTKKSDEGVQGSGKAVSISASELSQLIADAAAGKQAARELAETKAKGFIASAVSKGQIKTGDSGKWTKVLLASAGSQRADLETLITGLPVNAELGKERGDGGQEASTGARDELHTKVSAAIKASAEKGKTLKYTDAEKQILAADTALATRVKSEKEEQ